MFRRNSMPQTSLKLCVLKMVFCQLCDREFRDERGLSVHLARAHDVHGPRGRLSVKTLHRFFPWLKRRRWTNAERFLKQVMEKDVKDEWKKGYTQALKGIMITLKGGHSQPQPYILKLKRYDRGQLQEAGKEFVKLSKKPLKTEFEKGYFQAWTDYTRHLLHQRNRTKMKSKKR